jgi:hypothetical protein
MTAPVDSTARCLIPTSTPTGGPVGTDGTARRSWQVKLTIQRSAVRVTVAARMRPLPRSRWRASLRVDSWVLMRPSRGRVT